MSAQRSKMRTTLRFPACLSGLMMMDCNFLVEYAISCSSLQAQPALAGGAFAEQCVLALLSAEQLPGKTELSGDSVRAQSAPNQPQ